MPFAKGESGNPSGRPKVGQALSDCLRQIGGANLGRKKQSHNEVLAKATWQLVTEGKTTLPSGQVISLDGFADWFQLIKWIADRSDGRPFQQIDEATEARIAKLEEQN